MLIVMYKFLVDYLGSHPPTGQTMSDRVTESSVIPPRENSLDLLPVRHYDCYAHNLTSVASKISALILSAFRYSFATSLATSLNLSIFSDPDYYDYQLVRLNESLVTWAGLFKARLS